MATINGLEISDDALSFLKNDNGTPNLSNIDKLGAKEFSSLDAETIKFYTDLLIKNFYDPNDAVDTDEEGSTKRFAVLNAYADALYPNVSAAASPEKRNFIAKLDNGVRSFSDNIDSVFYADILRASEEQEEAAAELQREFEREAVAVAQAICTDQPQLPECQIGLQAPAGSTGAPTPDDEFIEDDVNIEDELGILSTSERPKLQTEVKNSWILAWEPTQQIGIVKVPLTKLLSALNTDADAKKKELLLAYDDALLFDINGLIDFKQINRRLFLPMSSNKLVLLKEFTIVRKNVQQIELTHGSKYFQVFTESFPEFSLSLEASKFADIAKKVKLFFDNMMKRISEANRYSGSLYLYDVLSSEILSHDVVKLNQLIASGQLIRYRLLPRSLKMSTTADDPNMLKITIDGIIVEWERQLQRMNIPSQAKTSPAATPGKPQTGSSSSTSANPEPQLIGPGQEDRYKELFVNLGFKSDGSKPPEYKSRIITDNVGNKLWTKPETAYFLKNRVSLWFIDEYTAYKDTDRQTKFTIPQYEDSFTKQALNEIYRDTRGLYSQIASFLLEKYEAAEDDKNNYYNRIIAEAMTDLGIGTGASGTANGPDIRAKFKEGFERYIDLVQKPASLGGEGKSGSFIDKFNNMIGLR